MQIGTMQNSAKVDGTRCVFFMLYGNHIVYVNTWPMKEHLTVLSENDLRKIFTAIDQQLVP
jgi:uncharacterized membrane protein YfbV (UPF0208 family)